MDDVGEGPVCRFLLRRMACLILCFEPAIYLWDREGKRARDMEFSSRWVIQSSICLPCLVLAWLDLDWIGLDWYLQVLLEEESCENSWD